MHWIREDGKMDKNEREKQLFKEWAGKNQRNFQNCSEQNGSYWIVREPGNYIREYAIDTIPDLKKELEKMWGDDPVMREILLPVSVAAAKKQPKTIEERDEPKANVEKLKPYIYNF